MSILVPSSHTRIGAWVNSKMYRGGKSTSILYYIINSHAKVSHNHRIHGKLGLQLRLLHYHLGSDGCHCRGFLGVDVEDVILGNCTISFVILMYYLKKI